MEIIEKRKWEEFQNAGLLWWVNRALHLFGWAIVLQVEDSGAVTDAYPARVQFRGFSERNESEGFIKLTEHLQQTMPDLLKEVRE